MTEVNALMKKIGELASQGLTSNDLTTIWANHQIQPLQARLTPMWQYSGSDDPTKTTPTNLEDLQFESKMKHLTQVRENLRREGPVPLLGIARPPPMVHSDYSSVL